MLFIAMAENIGAYFFYSANKFALARGLDVFTSVISKQIRFLLFRNYLKNSNQVEFNHQY